MAADATRTVLTLRARRIDPPRVGDLMASASGKTTYRLLGVVCVRTAGEPEPRYRLACARLRRCEVPDGVTIHPWRWDRRAPRQTAVEPPAAPSVATRIPPSAQTASTGRPSARTRVVEEGAVADLGPGLRRRAVRDRAGRLLREADVEVDDRAVDPRSPNRRLRRAYRVDPVDTLRRAGSIGPREADAAAELRRQLERLMPAMGGGSALRITISAFLVEPINDEHIRASRKLREASAALGERLWPPVLWVCLGGTVQGYSEQWRRGRNQVAELVQHGFHRLADHFYGRVA